jgi:hypothetical protein
MVIESVYASVAVVAMVGLFGSDDLALGAQVGRLKVLVQSQE